jgi:hypothetical protein
MLADTSITEAREPRSAVSDEPVEASKVIHTVRMLIIIGSCEYVPMIGDTR